MWQSDGVSESNAIENETVSDHFLNAFFSNEVSGFKTFSVFQSFIAKKNIYNQYESQNVTNIDLEQLDNNGTACLKNLNICLNINIYSYVETSGGQSSNLHLNVVHFFKTSVN